MKAFWVKSAKAGAKGYLVPFHVVGDVNFVIDELLKGESMEGFLKEDFLIEESKDVYLDPGGMLYMEEKTEFTLLDVPFSIRLHKLLWEMQEIREAKERVPGYFRVPQGPGSMPWFIYLTQEMRDLLLAQLMSYEFAPGVKEARDKAQERVDQAFLDGHLARPAEGGGFHVVEGVIEEPEDEDFTTPEGLEPF
jgi:hypothetical protein